MTGMTKSNRRSAIGALACAAACLVALILVARVLITDWERQCAEGLVYIGVPILVLDLACVGMYVHKALSSAKLIGTDKVT